MFFRFTAGFPEKSGYKLCQTYWQNGGVIEWPVRLFVEHLNNLPQGDQVTIQRKIIKLESPGKNFRLTDLWLRLKITRGGLKTQLIYWMALERMKARIRKLSDEVWIIGTVRSPGACQSELCAYLVGFRLRKCIFGWSTGFILPVGAWYATVLSWRMYQWYSAIDLWLQNCSGYPSCFCQTIWTWWICLCCLRGFRFGRGFGSGIRTWWAAVCQLCRAIGFGKATGLGWINCKSSGSHIRLMAKKYLLRRAIA